MKITEDTYFFVFQCYMNAVLQCLARVDWRQNVPKSSDVFVEGLLKYFKRNPVYIFSILYHTLTLQCLHVHFRLKVTTILKKMEDWGSNRNWQASCDYLGWGSNFSTPSLSTLLLLYFRFLNWSHKFHFQINLRINILWKFADRNYWNFWYKSQMIQNWLKIRIS